MAKKTRARRRTKLEMQKLRAKQAKAPKKEKKTRKSKADKKVMKPWLLVVTADIPDTVNEKEWKENFIEPIKQKRHRRTKKELEAAKAAVHDSDWDEKKGKPKKARKPKMKDKVEPVPNGFDDPIFTVKDRPKLSAEDLRVYLREKYTPHAGMRSADYILQLCDSNEHLENQLGILTHQAKGEKKC